MEVYFGSKRVADGLRTIEAATIVHGADMAEMIFQRLDELEAAESLDVMWQMGGKFHALHGNRKNQFAMSLVGAWRLVVKPYGDPKDYMDGNHLVKKNVRAVVVVGVIQYH